MLATRRDSFKVTFTGVSHTGSPCYCLLADLEPYVLAVDLGTETFSSGDVITHRTNTVIIWLADDTESIVMSTIRQHVKLNEQFQLDVQILKSETTSEVYTFKHCQLNALQHSMFSKEPQLERIELSIDGSHKYKSRGVIKPPEEREVSAKLLQLAFGELEHHIINNIQ